MCTFNIALDDNLVKTARQSFPDEKTMIKWMQEQMNTLLRSYTCPDSAISNEAREMEYRNRAKTSLEEIEQGQAQPIEDFFTAAESTYPWLCK